jgi:molybdopterin/thiamine biosynthesis adenylyltransferase
MEAAVRFEISFVEVEPAILDLGLYPARYQRNRHTISNEGQLALLQSCVSVIGCGGLGGYIVEQLARLGVGRIIAIDPDVFEEHNLNRQTLATLSNLGMPKVTAAASRVAEINLAVLLVPLQTAFCPENGRELLCGTTVVVDALDNIVTRLDLAGICRELGIPLVHGAIAGWYGQVTTQHSGEDISCYLLGAEMGGKGGRPNLATPRSRRRPWRVYRLPRSARSFSARVLLPVDACWFLTCWIWNLRRYTFQSERYCRGAIKS